MNNRLPLRAYMCAQNEVILKRKATEVGVNSEPLSSDSIRDFHGTNGALNGPSAVNAEKSVNKAIARE